MEQHVIFQVGRLAETTTANVTSERPQSVMYIHMTLQVTRCRKWFWTLRTFVWFLLEKRNEYFAMNIDKIIQKQINFYIFYIWKITFLFLMFISSHSYSNGICGEYKCSVIIIYTMIFFFYMYNNKRKIMREQYMYVYIWIYLEYHRCVIDIKKHI